MAEPVTQPEETSARPDGAAATASARVDGDTVIVAVGGNWRLRDAQPEPFKVVDAGRLAGMRSLVVEPDDLGFWDSSLALFVKRLGELAHASKVETDIGRMPAVLSDWLTKLELPKTSESRPKLHFPILTWVGLTSTRSFVNGRQMLQFLGECVTVMVEVMLRPLSSLRWGEVTTQMRRAGADALGIVGLITFLVGVILAFVAATQLRQFGADIYVANLVGLAMFREMGAMMAAIVIAGRTGAAYAAELGNMRLNEEIDALETFGVSSMKFLVMPRMLALIAMMPMLTLYADFLGSVGGLLVSKFLLQVPASAFVRQLESAVQLNDVFSGLVKSCFFGMIVAYASCLKGMNADRSAVGVGEATTAAVVLSILLIIIADAFFTVLFTILNF